MKYRAGEVSGVALLEALESGELRVAARGPDGRWTVHAWVKEAILELFRGSRVVGMGSELGWEAVAAGGGGPWPGAGSGVYCRWIT